MSRTLVIHPKDITTDCLEVIYRDRGWDIIRDPNTPVFEVKKAIREHDRIIMLGHGTPTGLLCAVGKNRFGRYIINPDHAEMLQTKDTLSIWCNSDQYFSRFGIRGLHTGMIISEVSEEWIVFGRQPLNSVQIAKNMEKFCGAFAHHINLTDPTDIAYNVLLEYTGNDEVTRFNRDNIIVL